MVLTRPVKSVKSIIADARAAVDDGITLPCVMRIAALNARHSQNAERDLHVLLRRELQIPTPLFKFSLLMPGQDDLPQNKTFGLILPHELFSHASAYNRAAFGTRFIGDNTLAFWRACEQHLPPWWAEHPLRPTVNCDPMKHLPARIHGDDAPMGKHGRSVLVLSWGTIGCRLESLHAKMLICALDVQDTKDNPALLTEVL